MRHIIKAAPTQPVKCAYDSVGCEKPSSATPAPVDDAVRILLPAFDSVNTILKRQRTSTLPKLPKSQADLVLSDEWEPDNSGQRFLLRTNGDKSNEMLLFVTNTNLERLSRCKTIYMVGTFKTCPGLYSQFFSVHGLINEHVVPLVFALLSDNNPLIINCYPHPIFLLNLNLGTHRCKPCHQYELLHTHPI